MSDELVQRFHSLEPQRRALARRRRLLDDPQQEVDLRMWEALVEHPERSDRELFWMVMTATRELRRRKKRDQRRLERLIAEQVDTKESTPEQWVLDRIEIAEAIASLPHELLRCVASRAGLTRDELEYTSSLRTGMYRWRRRQMAA